MIKLFRKAKLSTQIAVASCLVMLAPILILWFTMTNYLHNSALKTREQEARLRCSQFTTQAERIVEVSNMSTQVFLNTPVLISHLTGLKQGKEKSALELLEFYRQDISSLEKIVISNPELYGIRVYAAVDTLNEMMPILYSRSRMENMPWAENEILTGTWFLDHGEQLFTDTKTDHLMSLVTPIDTVEDGRIGVVEVCVRMDENLPELFGQEKGTCAVLLKKDGTLAAGSSYIAADMLAEIPFSQEAQIITLDGERCLVMQEWLKDFDCRYIQINSLADLDRAIWTEAILLMLLLALAFAVILYVVSRITRGMLGGFYKTFDGIRAFAEGDIDAHVEVQGEGEVAEFAREADGLLDKIKQLMQDNLEQERQARSAENRALHNQINAHFIYNVLEAIKMMAEIDEEYDIADAVTSLGKLLRYSMKWVNGNVMLQKEIEYIENYVALMNMRYDYEVSLRVDIPEELYYQRIPKISLQPIVENAVIHGTASLQEDSTISLTGEIVKEQGKCYLHISDEGRGMDEEELRKLKQRIEGEVPDEIGGHTGNGIGLHNVHSRIRQAFGKEYGLTVESEKNHGTTVTVMLPYQLLDDRKTTDPA